MPKNKDEKTIHSKVMEETLDKKITNQKEKTKELRK